MELPLVQMDAFTDRALAGNPAAVMVLPHWLDDALLAAIAAENNLSETAFLVLEPDGWRLRWFTPAVEVDLCGHATLAAGAALLRGISAPEITFLTRSGPLLVRREGSRYALRLPALPPHAAEPIAGLVEALGAAPVELFGVKDVHHARYWMAVYRTEAEVAALRPDFGRLAGLRSNAICTAPGAAVDFVSRFFAPGSGVDEDPVTGSAHATLTPFWAGRLGKNPLEARQISRRGGALTCRLDGDEVWLTGGCVLYLEGTVRL